MPNIVHDNILNSSDDAIINSLGYHEEVAIFGRICDAISKATHDEIEEEIINKGMKLRFGEVFSIDAKGDLKCKKIINVITPYRDNDNAKLTHLHNAYMHCFELANQEGMKSISVPMIGASSANGYFSQESFETAWRAAEEAEAKYPGFLVNINIFYCDYSSSKEDNEEYWERTSNRAEKYESLFEECDKNIVVKENTACLELGSGTIEDFLLRKPSRRKQNDEMFNTVLEVGQKKKALNTTHEIFHSKETPFSPAFEYALSKVQKDDSLGSFLDNYIYALCDHDDAKAAYHWKVLGGIVSSFKESSYSKDDIEYVLDDLQHKGSIYAEGSLKKNWSPHTITKGKFLGCNIVGWVKPCKVEIVVTCGSLMMSKREINWVLNFCGYCFSDFSNEDIALKNTIEDYDESYDKSWLNLLNLFQKNVGFSIYKLWREGVQVPGSIKEYKKYKK